MSTKIYQNPSETLYVNAMWGGAKRGLLHQITVNDVGREYVQITTEDLIDLRNAITKYLVENNIAQD